MNVHWCYSREISYLFMLHVLQLYYCYICAYLFILRYMRKDNVCGVKNILFRIVSVLCQAIVARQVTGKYVLIKLHVHCIFRKTCLQLFNSER